MPHIPNKRNFLFSLLFIVLLVGFFYIFRGLGRGIHIESESAREADEKQKEESDMYEPNSLSGLRCKNYARRPVAVMLSEDVEARPLSAIASADLIIEMPVVVGSITRMMAVFVCSDAEEMGSIRSSRDDFIPLARGYDAIYAHWGGSKIALDELNRGIIDNLDALVNPFSVFYRKIGIPAPHNGFAGMEKIIDTSGKLGYRLASNLNGYKFIDPAENSNAEKVLEIGYRRPYNIRYEYYPNLNAYFRWRGGTKEIDALTGDQVIAKNIVIMRTTSRPIGGGYNDVDVLGSGEATVYRNGDSINGRWVKEADQDALRFYDKSGSEIEFVPGQIWIEIVEPATEVIYK